MAYYKIAGLTVQMDLSGRTLQQAAPYEIPAQEAVQIRIHCDAEKILQAHPELGDLDTALYMGTGLYFAKELLQFHGFQLHSSAVEWQGKAYLFAAPSGTGKSTHTEKWCRLFGAKLLNDDKPVLRRQDGSWIAYGTPWSGKHDLSMPMGVPLGGIAFLRRGQENTICPMDPKDAVSMMLQETVRFLPREQLQQQLALVDRLLQEVPIWKLQCRNEDAAAQVSHREMTRDGVS